MFFRFIFLHVRCVCFVARDGEERKEDIGSLVFRVHHGCPHPFCPSYTHDLHHFSSPLFFCSLQPCALPPFSNHFYPEPRWLGVWEICSELHVAASGRITMRQCLVSGSFIFVLNADDGSFERSKSPRGEHEPPLSASSGPPLRPRRQKLRD